MEMGREGSGEERRNAGRSQATGWLRVTRKMTFPCFSSHPRHQKEDSTNVWVNELVKHLESTGRRQAGARRERPEVSSLKRGCTSRMVGWMDRWMDTYTGNSNARLHNIVLSIMIKRSPLEHLIFGRSSVEHWWNLIVHPLENQQDFLTKGPTLGIIDDQQWFCTKKSQNKGNYGGGGL